MRLDTTIAEPASDTLTAFDTLMLTSRGWALYLG